MARVGPVALFAPRASPQGAVPRPPGTDQPASCAGRGGGDAELAQHRDHAARFTRSRVSVTACLALLGHSSTLSARLAGAHPVDKMRVPTSGSSRHTQQVALMRAFSFMSKEDTSRGLPARNWTCFCPGAGRAPFTNAGSRRSSESSAPAIHGERIVPDPRHLRVAAVEVRASVCTARATLSASLRSGAAAAIERGRDDSARRPSGLAPRAASRARVEPAPRTGGGALRLLSMPVCSRQHVHPQQVPAAPEAVGSALRLVTGLL